MHQPQPQQSVLPSPITYGPTTDEVAAAEILVKIRTSVEIDISTYEQLMTYIRATHLEVSGLGHASYRDGLFTIHDLNLPKQKGSMGGTELNQEDVAKIMVNSIKSGDKRPLNFWWHSHVNMGTFWSGTDDDNCNRLVAGNPWLVSIVGCQNGDIRCRVDFSSPCRITLDTIPVNIVIPTVNQKLIDKWKKEVDNNLVPEILTVQYNGYSRSDNGRVHSSRLEKAIEPPPTRKRTMDGEIVVIKPDDQWEAEWPHEANCHAHDDGFGCEMCINMNCFLCRHNDRNPKVFSYGLD